MEPMTMSKDAQDEDRRARYVQFIARFTATIIMQGQMSRSEGEALVAAARAKILALFPGREATYELLYARRFSRILDEYTRPDPPQSELAARPM
jgi:hypothetical protein